MNKRAFIIILIIITIVTVSGCWDSKDLAKEVIFTSFAYDAYHGQDNKNKLTVTGLFPSITGEEEKEANLYSVDVETIGDSMEKIGIKSPNLAFYGMIQTAIYGDELAEKGIDNIVDLLTRSREIKNTIYMAVVDGRAETVIRTPMPESADTGVYLLQLLRNSNNDSFVPVTTLQDFAVNIRTIGRNPITPLLKVSDNNIEVVGTGIFKKDKLIGKVGITDTRSIVFLRGQKSRGFIPFEVLEAGKGIDKGTVLVENKRKVKVTRKEDKYTFDITIKLKGRLREHLSTKRLKENDPLIKKIENSIKADIETQCNEFIKKMQSEFKVDCIDICRYAMAKWKNELKSTIDKRFIEDADIKVNVEVDVKSYGELK